MESPIDSN